MAMKKSKTIVTPGTKVSQATIDKIKSMGMTAALKSANSASPEMREGIRRLYGATRYNKAVASKAASKPTDSRFSGVKKAAPKPTDSRFSGTKSTTANKAAAPVQKKDKNPLGGFSMIGRALGEPFGKNPKKKYTK